MGVQKARRVRVVNGTKSREHDLERLRIERRLRLEYAVTHELAEAYSLKEAAPKILQSICIISGWQRGEVWRMDFERNILVKEGEWQAPSREDSSAFSKNRQTLAPGESIAGRVWMARKPWWSADIADDLRVNEAKLGKASNILRSAFGVTLRSQGIHRGVLVLFSESVRKPDTDLTELLTSIGNQIGQFVKRKETEHLNAQLAAIVESSHDAIVGKTLDGTITNWNEGAVEMYGYSAKEAMGKNISFLIPSGQPNELPSILEKMRHGEFIAPYETVRKKKDGTLIHISLSVSPIKNSSGIIIGASAVARDISKQKRAEEEIMKLNNELEERVRQRTEQLENANKELETFSYSISHDLRAPLRAIDGFSRELLLRHTSQLDSDGQHYFSIIRDKIKKMGLLIDDLLAFSRVTRQEFQKTEVDMEAIARAVTEDVRKLEEHSHAAVTIGALPRCLGSSSLLHQVFVNLISNAFKFSRHMPNPHIEIGADAGNEEHTYYVKDNGVGFDPEHAKNLFGVFQRLHDEKDFEGTGIGLAIVQRIVYRHGGKVWAESAPGRGAIFYFTLPSVKERRLSA